MADFETTGDLVSDLQLSIDNNAVMLMSYVDRKGDYSSRTILPLEVRGDRFYAVDLDKMGLRLFILDNVQDYNVTDEVVDPDSLSLT